MTTPTLTAAASPPPSGTKSLRGLVLVVILGTLVVQLDGTMLGVALNSIRAQFAVDVTTVQWVTTGYLMSMTLVIPVTGWAMSRVGARPVWLGSLAMFAIASVGCALSRTAGSLIAVRIVQGLAGGFLIPLGQALLAQAAAPDQLGHLMGAIGLPAMAGVVLGPLVGGVIVTNLGWTWVFWVNLPIIVVALLASRTVLARGKGSTTPVPLDRLGLALLPPGLALVVFGVTRAAGEGTFTARAVLLPAATGALLVAGFGLHAWHTRAPLVDLHLFRRPSFSAATGVMTLIGFAMFGLVLLVPLYLQQARGWTALHAGLLALPQGLGMAVALIVSGRLTTSRSPRTLVGAGLLLTLSGLGMLTQLTDQTGQLYLVVAGLVTGLGLGATTVPATTACYQGLAQDAIPQATSAIRVFQQLGGVVGSAVLAVVLQQQLQTAGPSSTGLISSSYATTFTWALLVTAIAALPTLFLPRSPSEDDPRRLRGASAATEAS